MKKQKCAICLIGIDTEFKSKDKKKWAHSGYDIAKGVHTICIVCNGYEQMARFNIQFVTISPTGYEFKLPKGWNDISMKRKANIKQWLKEIACTMLEDEAPFEKAIRIRNDYGMSFKSGLMSGAFKYTDKTSTIIKRAEQ